MRQISNMLDLSGRVALVTGGAGHIGLAACEGLIEFGAELAILDLDRTQCEERIAGLKLNTYANLLPVACDLRDESQTRQSIRSVIDHYGRLDILVHCAAYVGTTNVPGWGTSFDSQSVEAWDDAIRINLTSAFIMVQEAKEALASSGLGSVILFGSTYGITGPDMSLYEGTTMANPTGYAASKGGVLQLTRYLATFLAPTIRVNSISPGGIVRGQPQIFQDRYIKRTPMARMATEEDIKGAIVYLACDMSSYVTGHNLVVDGGWTAW